MDYYVYDVFKDLFKRGEKTSLDDEFIFDIDNCSHIDKLIKQCKDHDEGIKGIKGYIEVDEKTYKAKGLENYNIHAYFNMIKDSIMLKINNDEFVMGKSIKIHVHANPNDDNFKIAICKS